MTKKTENNEQLRALLIDPFTKTITETTVSKHDDSLLQDMYRLIGCDTVEVVRYQVQGVEVDIWVDEEGLFKADQKYFLPYAHPQGLAGKGLVLEHDGRGNCKSTKLSTSHMQNFIAFQLM